jgi:hypothetical protein
MEMDYSNTGIWALLAATFILATTHTLSPDHWFPVVMVGRANRWKISWVMGLAVLAGAGHVGISVGIGLIGVFAKTGAAKGIATFLENTTPILLMVFGFSYAAYAFYTQRMGAHGHSHGIPIVNRLLGIDPHAYELPENGHHHEHSHEGTLNIHLGNVDLYLHNMELHMEVVHTDHHHHDHDAPYDKRHEHEHTHDGGAHNHRHQHQDITQYHAHAEQRHSEDASRHDHEEHHHMHHDHGDHRHGNDEHHPGHQHSGHEHTHDGHQHAAPKIDLKNKRAVWGLVAILGLTPCIALLPLTFAAVRYGTFVIIMVNAVFAVATIGTIMLFSWLGMLGLSWIKLEFFDEYGDIIAGVTIGLLGLATKLLEL